MRETALEAAVLAGDDGAALSALQALLAEGRDPDPLLPIPSSSSSGGDSDDDQQRQPLLLRAITNGCCALAAALVERCRGDDVAADALAATPGGATTTWFELCVRHNADSVVAAYAARADFDATARTADGRTLLEVALSAERGPASAAALACAAARRPLACVSSGKTVFERLLAEQDARLVLPMLAPGGGELRGTERLGDGTTVFERLLAEKGSAAAAAAAVALAGCVEPHATASTGDSFFERALASGAADVVGKLAAHGTFDPMERTHDGCTMLELLLRAPGMRGVALAVLGGGRVPANALLSDGRTAFEHVLRLNAKELILGAFAGQALKPAMALPPEDKSCFELCLACPPGSAGAELAFIMVRFAGLDGLHVLGDGRTCFERVLVDRRQELAVAMVESGSVKPASRLPDGRTCIDFAASVGARDVCQALAKHV